MNDNNNHRSNVVSGKDLPHQPVLAVPGDPDAEPCTITFSPEGIPSWDEIPNGTAYSVPELIEVFDVGLRAAEQLVHQLVYASHPLVIQFVRRLLHTNLEEWHVIEEAIAHVLIYRRLRGEEDDEA